ncbi:MAG: hypothetical protein H0V01_05130 [Bacteroidetes bacterium]|nr:hypothetical protein [Bacteroidota bacterium]HET6244800.1 hypothetical protein [Bacteroidia bacterium]
MKKHIALLLFSCCFSLLSYSQVNVEDSIISTPIIVANYAYQFPGGNLKDRFGNNSSIGISFLQKTKQNWLWGFEFSFIFGGKVKEDSLFRNISTKNDFLINQHGAYAEIRFFERGHLSTLKGGRLFPALGPNPNCGFIAIASVGLLQHKIRIENPENNTPQILNDYKKGYDRLTNGLAVSEFFGYMYLSNNRLLNFYGGVEFVQAWTQNRRDFNFDTMEKDNTRRNDFMSGIKVGWVIPLYKKMPNKFYYY